MINFAEDVVPVVVDSLFKVHRLNADGMDKAQRIAVAFTELLRAVELAAYTKYEAAPGARDLAIVRTKLQEASFFAKRAMAMAPENHEK